MANFCEMEFAKCVDVRCGEFEMFFLRLEKRLDFALAVAVGRLGVFNFLCGEW